MTNSAIILEYMVSHNLDPLTVVLHTYATWKSLGYQVKHGEKSEHSIPVWRKSTKKVEIENNNGDIEQVENGRYYIKLSAFFTQNQVERIEK